MKIVCNCGKLAHVQIYITETRSTVSIVTLLFKVFFVSLVLNKKCELVEKPFNFAEAVRFYLERTFS